MLTLRKLKVEDEDMFMSGLEHWKGDSLHWYTFDWKPGISFKEHLVRLSKNIKGIDLPKGHVPSSMLYGFINNEIIGRVSIRHELNDHLAKRGGHIGYSVAAKFRQRGYATEMVAQALLYCKSIRLKKILITCALANTASWKVIEKVGGQLEEEVFDDESKEMIKKYWVIL